MRSIFFIMLTLFILIGCGGGGEDNSISTSFNNNEKKYLASLLQNEYLWSDEISSSIDINKYSTPQEMIDALVPSKDKWSFVITKAQYDNWNAQESSGFGCYFSGRTILYYDYDSPCETSGLLRGDEILEVNHESVTSSNFTEAQNALNKTAILTINRASIQKEITITPKKYEYKVAKTAIFSTQNGKKVGLLIFNEFSEPSSAELDEAFSKFKMQQIDELVVDLRYNGGGSLSIASILLDKIAGDKDGFLQYTLKWNPNNQDKNEKYYFSKDNNSLENLTKVIFLTSKYTASASEAVIYGLKPYKEVILIGEKTHGKPVGMQGRTLSYNYIYFLINFSLYNALNEGDYYSGIEVTCNAIDDLTHQREEQDESMLKSALYYIDFQSCL